MQPRSRMVGAAVLAGIFAVAPILADTQAPGPVTKSLYERLGGLYNIGAVVDDFIERIYVNQTLNANPAISQARSQLRKPGLKVQVSMLVCEVTGGPCKYVGKGMKEAHAGFGITEKEWGVMVDDFKATLAKFKVPAAEQQELINIVATTKPDIVVDGASPARK